MHFFSPLYPPNFFFSYDSKLTIHYNHMKKKLFPLLNIKKLSEMLRYLHYIESKCHSFFWRPIMCHVRMCCRYWAVKSRNTYWPGVGILKRRRIAWRAINCCWIQQQVILKVEQLLKFIGKLFIHVSRSRTGTSNTQPTSSFWKQKQIKQACYWMKIIEIATLTFRKVTKLS